MDPIQPLNINHNKLQMDESAEESGFNLTPNACLAIMNESMSVAPWPTTRESFN